MDKEERSTLVLQEDEQIGSVKIADDVVAMIAGIAATEVEGVSSTSGNMANELMSMVGYRSTAKGVKVDIRDKTASVDVAVTMEYGYNIPATSKLVQEKVKSAIENMTGLTVAGVNIRIADIKVEKEA